MGYCMLNENLVRGMAAYAINLDGFNRNKYNIGGVNTTANTPW